MNSELLRKLLVAGAAVAASEVEVMMENAIRPVMPLG